MSTLLKFLKNIIFGFNNTCLTCIMLVLVTFNYTCNKNMPLFVWLAHVLQRTPERKSKMAKKMQVRHAPLEPEAPNKSTSIFCHKPVNLLGIDNCEDRSCVWLRCGWGFWEKISDSKRTSLEGLDTHDKKTKGKKKPRLYFSQLLPECWVKSRGSMDIE